MPDFSKAPSPGWGGGADATNATVYLLVLEEWLIGSVGFVPRDGIMKLIVFAGQFRFDDESCNQRAHL